MSTIFSKHFPLCFFNLKFPKHSSSNSSASPSTTTDTTFLFNHPPSDSTDDFFSSSSDSDSWDPPPPPDFASIFASHRFFFSSPGLSNSIIESPDTRRPSHTTTTTTNNNRNNNNNNNDNDNETTSLKLVPKSGGIGVPKYSINPYLDFRHSMQEMIESRELEDVREDWDYLHDLFLCYLALNPSHTHRYIVRAFTDLVVDLLSSTPPPPPPSSVPEFSICRKKHKTRRHKSFSGRLV